MKLILSIYASFLLATGFAQENVYPVPFQKGMIFLKNGTVHTGTGQVLENATIKIANGKIVELDEKVQHYPAKK